MTDPVCQRWYHQSEKELADLCLDAFFRGQMEKRLGEMREVNRHGMRCIMTKEHVEKLERVLAQCQSPE